MSEWISIDNKFPPLEKSVRVKNEYNEIYEATLYFEGELIYNDEFNIIGIGEPEHTWSVELGFGFFCGYDITHWQPLPPPP